MGSYKLYWLVLVSWVLSLLCFGALCEDDSQVSVKFLKAPHAFSHLKTAKFVFQVLVGGNESSYTNFSISCKLDRGSASDCGGKKIFYEGLQDGNHAFEVCINGSQGNSCSAYNWTVDTVPPTAYITASSSFTNALNVSVNISFTEPCTGGGGFGCSSVNACNLLVYGAGQVIPSSYTVLRPNLEYSLLVDLSPTVLYGRVILAMDKNFCTDNAGNSFTRGKNSTLFVHFDRRSVFVDLRTHIPEKLLALNNQTRTVQATNNYDRMKVYLYFSEPVVNSTAEILSSISTSEGTLVPIGGDDLGERRFGFQVENVTSIAIVTVAPNASSIKSRAGSSVSPIAPVTFLYDSQRPAVRLSTTSETRTKKHSIPISIKFMKPVFGFNSSLLSISGGHLQRFHEVSRNKYIAEIQAEDHIISVNVPQNVTADVAGNKNLASNVLQVRHYSVPLVSCIISTFATAAFLATSFAAGLLTISTASLQSVGQYSSLSSLLTSDPARNLFMLLTSLTSMSTRAMKRSAHYIQVFALSRWLAVLLPVEYYEFARGMQWSIPYFSLPWETGGIHPIMVGSNSSIRPLSYISNVDSYGISHSGQSEKESMNVAPVYGLPLTPMEYRLYFENQHVKPEAEYIPDSQHSNGWRDFDRSMFWLGITAAGLILIHLVLLSVLKLRKKNSDRELNYGALTFPRLEIFLIILALPCVCEASAALIRGGTPSGLIVGGLLLGAVGILLMAFLLFFSFGITLGKLLQYKEVHQEGQIFHWYQELVRVTLGPGKKGQWTWRNQPNSVYRIMLGPLFEDLRGPPKYMLSQISGGTTIPTSKQSDRIIASDDETEDAEAPFIQKVFGILRIYYTMLELVKRVSLGILASAFLDDWSSKTPTIVLLCMTSFQLFFIVLKKPFIKKKVQLVEIISISCQVGLFGACFVLLEKELSVKTQTNVGIFMITLFLIGFMTHMLNEWCALYRQTMRLDPAENSFTTGLKAASIGFLLLFTPKKMSKDLESKLPGGNQQSGGRQTVGETAGSSSARSRSGSSAGSTTDKPWLKQLREMAKASFTKEGAPAPTPTDPSTSRTKWSGFWGTKRSGSSSQNSSSDSNAKPNQLYRDLEAIFAS